MSCDIYRLDEFERAIKILSKHYKSFKQDYANLLDNLRNDPHQGVEIAPNVRKVRMAITSKGRGKPGGARVITYDALVADMGGTLVLVTIYDKKDQASVDPQTIIEILDDNGY